MARLAARTATGELAAMAPAISSAVASAVPAGTSRSASPIRSASAAFTRRPVSSRSAARPTPSRRMDSWVPPQPGTRPTVASGSPNCAVSSATTRSQFSASSQPPPRAYPCTAAITGCGSRSSSPNAVRNTARWASHCASVISCRSLRSAPTQKARSPVAVSTTARTPVSGASSAQVCANRTSITVFSAFSASGRSSTISTTGPRPIRCLRTSMPSMCAG